VGRGASMVNWSCLKVGGRGVAAARSKEVQDFVHTTKTYLKGTMVVH